MVHKEALAYAYGKGYDLIVVTNQSGVATRLL